MSLPLSRRLRPNPALRLRPEGSKFAAWSPTFHRYVALPPAALRVLELFLPGASVEACLSEIDFGEQDEAAAADAVLGLVDRLCAAGILLHDTARRLTEAPIVHAGLHPSIGSNINGPSLIRVPSWIPDPLGRYYLYFAHHRGSFIRMAYADRLEGPWTVHPPGTLALDDTPCRDHIASPDVHVDDERRTIVMYFHGGIAAQPGGDIPQRTFYAQSGDGLRFEADADPIAPFYLRAFHHDEEVYAVAKTTEATSGGVLLRSKDGRMPFERGSGLLPRMRHCAVRKTGDQLLVFYSRIEDCPERIVVSTIDLRGDWTQWVPSTATEVLGPATEAEGVLRPLEPSHFGGIDEPVRQLRDPCIFEENGRTYLVYAVAGESGLGIAELQLDP